MKNSSENPAREEDKEAQGAEAEPNTAEKRLPEFINLLPMTYLNSFPGLNSAISVDESLSRQIVEDSWNKGEMMALFALKGAEADPANLKTEEFYETGVAVKITDVAPAESGLLKAYVKGICRVRMTGVMNGEIPLARVDEVPEDPADANDPELVPLMFEAKRLYTEIVSLMPGAPADPFKAVRMLDESPGLLADLLLAALPLNPKEKAEYFLIRGVKARFEALIGHLSEERAKRQVGAALSKKIQEGIEKRQKEMFLREHLKAIRDELGEGEEGAGENQKLFERVAALPLPPEARAAADREAERLKATPSSSAEHAGIRNWLEWIADLPWGDSTPAIGSVGRAREILERDHYGMEKVKKRVLEFLAVHQLTAETAKTPVLCLTGPPGVGKTSLARSIAEATGRKFTRLSLGGVRDESEIRGHRRTYVGARPGRLIAGLKKAGSDNPVFLLDELDKMGHGYQGDPAAALLEALDPEQNETFTDSYLEVPFDLSKVLFVLTANVLENIPAPLRDRLEVVELSGYTENEKAEIALRHIWPRELKRHGLEEGELSVSKEVLSELISGWTSEAGCRGLARGLSAVIRSRAVLKAEGLPFERDFPASDLASALGPPRRRPEKAADSAQVGVVTGLAWTAAGGDLMFVEAISMPGSGKLQLTGQLGDVLKESAQAAVSYVRSQSEVWKLDQAWFRSRDIHVHLPQGAIPKDGPSAGVALATAIVSLVSGQKVRSDVAMTGEISFRGLVLPIGGVKEKLLAARRAGIRTVVIPEDNQDEAISLGSEVIDGLSIVPVKTLDQVLALALIPSPDDSIMAGCLPDPAAAVLPGGVRWDSGITSLSL